MKKTIAVIAAAAIAVTGMAGCGNNKNKDAEKTLTKLTYWASMPSNSTTALQSLSDMTMYKELEKRTGIQVEFINPPVGQETEQFNLMIASGIDELPDLIETNWTGYPGGPDKAISDNVIIDLKPYLEKSAPNYKKALDENELYKKQVTSDSGAVFGFAALNVGDYRTFGGLIIRQDWLDDLGLPMPRTRDEWETTLRAFRDKKGAKAPYTTNMSNFYTYHFNNFFNVGMTAYVDNKKYKIPQLQPEFKEFVAMMNKWYKEGLLDNEYDTNDGTIVDAKMTNGTSGVTYGFIGGTIGRYVNAMKEKDPKYKLSAAPFPIPSEGGEARFTECQKEANSPHLAITGNCKNPAAAAQWIDYLYSEEGNILKNFGVEGETYNVKDGHYVYTDEILNNPNGLSIAEAMGKHFRSNAPAPGFCQMEDYLNQYYQLQEQKDALPLWSEYTKNARETIVPPITLTLDETEEIASLSAEIDTYRKEMVLKFIKGLEPMENYDKFVETLKSMGAERLEEIYQGALDRYYKR